MLDIGAARKIVTDNGWLSVTPPSSSGFVEGVRMGWVEDWMLGLPLTVFTIVLHVAVFVLIREGIRRAHSVNKMRARVHFIVGIALTALAAAALHSFEAGLWARLYMGIGALPDGVTAMLYSLSAITSYGHASVFLEERWRLLGAIEAMNGLILFGLTTAFLFAAIESVREPR